MSDIGSPKIKSYSFPTVSGPTVGEDRISGRNWVIEE